MRTDILDRKEDILEWISLGYSKAKICQLLACKQSTLNSYLKKMGIDYQGKQGHSLQQIANNYISAEEYSKKDYVQSDTLKKKLIREGIKEQKCEECGLTEWRGKAIPLELHHIDGNHYNNDFINLQILCPNCHALKTTNQDKIDKFYSRIKKDVIVEPVVTTTVKMTEKKICPICNINEIDNRSSMCKECFFKSERKVERPDRETLKQLIRAVPFVQLGNEFNVSDNAVRKWCDYYKLPRKKSEINSYSDEEWEKI